MPFFPVSCAAELSIAQSLFLYWTEVYDWALSLPENERPAEYVIEEDELFDDWYKQYVAKMKSEQRKLAAQGNTKNQNFNTITFD